MKLEIINYMKIIRLVCNKSSHTKIMINETVYTIKDKQFK